MKKNIIKYLEKLKGVKRRKHHSLIHRIHKKYRISKKTLFYVKEYGEHSNVPRTIIKESIKILVFASILSAFGGFALESIKTLFISIIPLIILLPNLNDMIGDYGTIISSRFSVLLHEGKIRNRELRKLFFQILIISLLIVMLSTFASLIISLFAGFKLDFDTVLKIFIIGILDIAILVSLIFAVAIFAGVYFYRRGEDPNNFLIPISTSIADFGNMIVLALLILI